MPTVGHTGSVAALCLLLMNNGSPLEKTMVNQKQIGTKHSVLTDEKRSQPTMVISGATTYDIKLLVRAEKEAANYMVCFNLPAL